MRGPFMSTKFVGVTPVTLSSSCPPSPWFQVLLNIEANHWGVEAAGQ